MTLWFRALFVFVLAGACLRVFFLFVYPQDLSLPGFSGIIFGLVNDAAAFAMVAGVVALAGYLGLYFFSCYGFSGHCRDPYCWCG